jgi:restriction system protein
MIKVWLLRPLPHGTNQMQYFLDNNRIAVGYPVGGSLANLSHDELRERLRNAPNNENWESGIGNVVRLVRFMKPGDIVVVPDENARDVYLAEIISDYIFEPHLDENREGTGFPHQREVRWFFDKQPVIRNELPEALLKSLRFPGATAELSKHLPLIAEIIGDANLVETEHQPDTNIGHLIDKALQVLEDALNSPDVNVSLQAADIVLRYSKL